MNVRTSRARLRQKLHCNAASSPPPMPAVVSSATIREHRRTQGVADEEPPVPAMNLNASCWDLKQKLQYLVDRSGLRISSSADAMRRARPRRRSTWSFASGRPPSGNGFASISSPRFDEGLHLAPTAGTRVRRAMTSCARCSVKDEASSKYGLIRSKGEWLAGAYGLQKCLGLILQIIQVNSAREPGRERFDGHDGPPFVHVQYPRPWTERRRCRRRCQMGGWPFPRIGSDLTRWGKPTTRSGIRTSGAAALRRWVYDKSLESGH